MRLPEVSLAFLINAKEEHNFELYQMIYYTVDVLN